jgi:sensor domain CHASE-containing protein
METKGKESVKEIEKTEMQRSIETIVKIKSEALYNIVNEDTLWNDLIDFTKYPDKQWAEENISSIITPNESLVFISVYNKEYKNIFTYYNNWMKERIEFYQGDFNKLLKEPKPVITYLKKTMYYMKFVWRPLTKAKITEG